jgi:hypothetical protein
VYSLVLNRLDPANCPLITDESLLARAGKAINNAKAMGADVFLKPKVGARIPSAMYLVQNVELMP